MSGQPKQPMWKGFAHGSIAAMAGGAASHPFDLLKVRLQIQGEGKSSAAGGKLGMVGMVKSIVNSDGPTGLFRGLSASLFRQCIYSGTRFGVYDVMKNYLQGDSPSPSVPVKIVSAGVAGAVGASVGSPGDLAMVRMQADGKLPVDQRRNYKHIFDALARISREEGVGALWRGCLPNMNRAVIVTLCQFASYDTAKEALLSTGAMQDGPVAHFSASLTAGVIASVGSNPVDVMKTRIMNQTFAEDGTPQYKGQLDCARKLVTSEGLFALYKGLIPTFTRQAPFVVVTFMTLEQVKKYI